MGSNSITNLDPIRSTVNQTAGLFGANPNIAGRTRQQKKELSSKDSTIGTLKSQVANQTETAEEEKNKRLKALQYQAPQGLGTVQTQSFNPFKSLLGQ